MTKTLTRLYDDYPTAELAMRNLESAGLSKSDISIVASNADGWYKPGSSAVDPAHDKDRDGSDDRAEGAATGGGIGAVAGGTIGALAGLGLLAIPGIGPVVAAGWLAATAAGAVAGGATGGLLGALAESGVSKENAELYAEALRRGGALVTARVPDDEVARYDAILNTSAVNVADRAGLYRESGWKGYTPDAIPYDADQVRKERALYRH